jgi:hypothetical protein
LDTAKLRLWFHGLTWNIAEHVDLPFVAINGGLPPKLSCENELDFGTVNVDTIKTMTLHISDTGCTSLRVDSIVSTDPTTFIVHAPTMPANVASEQTLYVTVTYTPHAAEPSLESIEIGTSGGHRFISLYGVGFKSTTASVSASDGEGFAIYPNPASSYIRVARALVRSAMISSWPRSQSNSIVIEDLLGREVLRADGENPIDISSLSEGAYVVRGQNARATQLIIARP